MKFTSRLALLSLFAFSVGMLHAEDEMMYLYLKNGDVVRFELEAKPVISFSGDMLAVGGGDYAIENVSKYTFRATNSLIDNIAPDSPIIRFDGKSTLMVKAGSSDAIRLFSIDGICRPVAFIPTSDGYLAADVSDLQPGYYLLSVGETTIKIRKR